jgi:hypothetical protein
LDTEIGNADEGAEFVGALAAGALAAGACDEGFVEVGLVEGGLLLFAELGGASSRSDMSSSSTLVGAVSKRSTRSSPLGGVGGTPRP